MFGHPALIMVQYRITVVLFVMSIENVHLVVCFCSFTTNINSNSAQTLEDNVKVWLYMKYVQA